MTAALHVMIGMTTRCFEEKHDQQVEDLEERVRIQVKIIVKYIEKYGKLRAKANYFAILPGIISLLQLQSRSLRRYHEKCLS